MFYSSDASATRAFLRDVLGLPFTDVGRGWLIFDVPEADLGVHPIDPSGKPPAPGSHGLSFYCDDIHATVAELRGRGVQLEGEIEDYGYGFAIHFAMPGEIRVQLYQPKYEKSSRASRPAG